MRTYDEVVKEMTDKTEAAKAIFDANVSTFMEEMTKRSISTVEIQFYGGGDSGELEYILADDLMLDHNSELYDLADKLGWEFAEQVETDWYNNDGGNVNIVIDAINKTFTAKTYYNVTVTELGESTTIRVLEDGRVEREDVTVV